MQLDAGFQVEGYVNNLVTITAPPGFVAATHCQKLAPSGQQFDFPSRQPDRQNKTGRLCQSKILFGMIWTSQTLNFLDRLQCLRAKHPTCCRQQVYNYLQDEDPSSDENSCENRDAI